MTGTLDGPVCPPRTYDYERDGQAIYRASFATIRAETDLSHVPADAEKVAVRMVHASGQTDLTRDLAIHPDLVRAARTALTGGAPILCDAHMVASGVTRARLPRGNEVVCIGERPRPDRQVGEVLVALRAATVNRADLYMRDSGAGITHRLPMIMGEVVVTIGG